MAIEFFFTAGSAPCRLVLLTAAALNIHLDLKEVNLGAGEQFKPEYLKINPQHTVPTIVDDGFILRESRSIARYLVNKYGKDSNLDLYPEDIKLRALVDQQLDFDLGTLYPRFGDYFYPQIFAGIPASKGLLKRLNEGLSFFNTFLEGQTFAAGDQLSLADLSLVATVSTIDAAGISLAGFDNVVRWFELVKKTAPGYQKANGEGVKVMQKFAAQIKIKSEL